MKPGDRLADEPVALNDAPEGAQRPGSSFRARWLRIAIAVSLLTLLMAGVLIWAVLRGGPAVAPASEQDSLSSQGSAPDFELTNQDSRKVRLSDFRGRVVLMTFFYADCPNFCSLMNLNFKQVRDSLDQTSRKRLILLSISFDPLADTPRKLKAYAAERGFNEPGWHFLTGTAEDIAQIIQAYGIVAQESEPEVHVHADGTRHVHDRDFSHLAQALLIDQKGEVRKAYLGVPIGSQVFSVEDFVKDIRGLLGSEKG